MSSIFTVRKISWESFFKLSFDDIDEMIGDELQEEKKKFKLNFSTSLCNQLKEATQKKSVDKIFQKKPPLQKIDNNEDLESSLDSPKASPKISKPSINMARLREFKNVQELYGEGNSTFYFNFLNENMRMCCKNYPEVR